MINQILQAKLEKFYEAESVDNWISSTLSMFDMINLVFVVEKRKINNIKLFNNNWKNLHGGIFEEIIERARKEIETKNKPKYVKIKKDNQTFLLEKQITSTNKEDFNTFVNIILDSEEDCDGGEAVESRRNIKNAINKLFPFVISYLNKEPELKIVSGEISGDIGILKNDI